jgi:O-antigen ligase
VPGTVTFNDPMADISTSSWDASRTFWVVRSYVFYIGVIAMNYTWMRPSPVDLIFLSALGLCLLVNQPVRKNFITALAIIVVWVLSYMNASLPYAGDSDVQHELLAKTFVALLAILSAYIASSWRQSDFSAFFMVYLVSTTIAASIGIVAFAIGHPSLTWDGRAMAFIDDPNMYASFLIPGVLAAIFLIKHRRVSWLLGTACALIITTGIAVAFSRIASVALIFVAVSYLGFLNRHQLPVFLPKLVIITLVGVLALVLALSLSEEFAAKFLERLTFAKSYDLGREGRLGRYLLVLPMILQDPVGVGVLQLERIFPEPIHNIFLSAFVNYGWLGGFSWLFLFFGSLVASLRAYRLTGSDVPIMLMFAVLGITMCASLHEAEHWRHLWLFLGMAWGFSATTFGACTDRHPRAMSSPSGRSAAW